MKHARKALVFLLLLVTPLLLAGILPSAIDNEVEATLSPLTTKVSVPSYEEQTPILAYNDFDMDNYASALSWAGDGTPDTPYIIEGYNITSDSNSILIHDTTKAFEIRNCLITSYSSGSGNGIIINNATQVAIVDTFVMDKSDTIDVRNVPSLYIENCTVSGGGSSFYINNCTGTTITECNIYNNFEHGINLIACNFSTISNNVVNHTYVGAGINFELSHYVTIIGNHIFDCAASGVYAFSSPYATVEDNIIHDNLFLTGPMCGIHLETSPFASVVGNTIYDNARNGIFVIASDWVYIFDNEIFGNSDHGIDVIFSNEGTILQNNIHGNGYWPIMMNSLCGIYLGPVLNFTISDNMIWNNTPSGISIEGGEHVDIFNNDIFNNTDIGVFANGMGFDDLVMDNNRIHGNGYDITSPFGGAGILTYGYDFCIIKNNLVYNNSDFGISINGDDNVIIGNEVYDNSMYGISTAECYDNFVTENTVHHNRIGIFVMNIGTNITHNIIYDNEYGIYSDASGDCRFYGNDIGWNDMNAFEGGSFEGMFMLWDDNVSIGNWWHDYDGGGIYWIFNDTHGVSSDRFPSISLNLTQASSISFEILEIDNYIEWEAYALNPSHYELFVDGSSVLVEDWDGGNIEYLADGLSHGTHTIEVVAYHISGHSMGNGTAADVEDLTPPSGIEGPILIEITFGDDVSAQFSAEDPSGIDQWAVNDTVNFEISSTGLLTSLTDLPIGNYVIRITATDPYGHSTTLDVTVTVAAPAGLPTELILAIGAGGAIVLLIVGVLVYKTKKG